MKRKMAHYIALVAAVVAIMFSGHAQAQTCTPVPNGLVSWWPGDGNAEDIAGDNDGTLLGNVGFITGKVGQAFSLDGNNYVEVGIRDNLKFGTGAFTIELWARPNTLSGGGGARWFMSRNNFDDNVGFRFGIWHDRLVYRDRSTREDIYGSVLTPGETIHVAVVRRGTGIDQLELFLNGNLDAVGTSGGDFNDNSPFQIGRPGDRWITVDKFDGFLDEVTVFDRDLAALEIEAIFLAGSAGKCEDPVSALNDLIQDVIDLDLQQGISMAADAKLDNAFDALQDTNENNDGSAINRLFAFINAVEAQRGNKITDVQADELVAQVNQIIASLEGN